MRATFAIVAALAAFGAARDGAAQNGASPPRPRVADVIWPEQGPVAAAANRPALKGLRRIGLPVLIPRRMLADRRLVLTGEAAHYTASVREGPAAHPTATLSITGTRIAFDLPGGKPASPSAAPTDATVEAGEQSASAGYVRFGAAYRVDIECGKANDPRCADGRYARGLLDSVELAGGNRGAPARAPTLPPAPGNEMVAASAPPPDFYRPAGELAPGSGTGVRTTTIYLPNMRFPVESPPAYLNSQVYGVGGMSGPPGSASDPRNYAYPWSDNFCEKRARATPICPGGKGHQGQDIRPAGPGVARYWAVAAERGHVANIGSYSVTLAGGSGTQYRYLHLAMGRLDPRIRIGAAVERGQHIGLISNEFGASKTTVHLHFEMLQNLDGRGLRHVPPYTSLVAAYRQL